MIFGSLSPYSVCCHILRMSSGYQNSPPAQHFYTRSVKPLRIVVAIRMNFQDLLKVVLVEGVLGIIFLESGLGATSAISFRSRRNTERYCTYSYVGECEKVVYDPIRCSLTGQRDCFRTVTSDCDINYVDCCEGFIMDDEVCYPKDEICDDCFTITDCNEEVTRLSSRQGTLSSNNYPQEYDDNVDCTWTIRGGRNSTVSISILDLQLQDRRSECFWNWDLRRPDCRETCLDWIILQAGSRSDSPSTKGCVLNENSETFASTGSVVQVHFHSDSSVSKAGFQLVFSIIGGAEPPVATTNIPRSSTLPPESTMAATTDAITHSFVTTQPEFQKCPGNLIWSRCPKCTRTCNNALKSEKDCQLSSGRESDEIKCEPGCVCPKNFPIWHNLKCVKYDACLAGAKTRVVDHCAELGLVKGDCLSTCDNMHISTEKCLAETLAGHTGSVCVCKFGRLLHEGNCLAPGACQRELNKRCSGGKVWSACASECEKTCVDSSCKGRNGKSSCIGACRCPSHRPIYHKNRCIKRQLCPANGDVVCGKQFYQPVLKIIGGDRAMKGSWPWLVQIEKKVDGEFTLSCGGTLICEKWVLTASHCFLSAGKTWLEKDTWKYRIHIGKHYKKFNVTDVDAGMLANINPSRIITHESYHLTTHVNDLALVELPKPVRWNRFIRPACIHNVSDYHPLAALGETCMSAGWGAETNTDGPGATQGNPVLKQVELAARTHSLCTALFFNFNIETMHCVGGHKNQDTCAGDSGGPLMCLRNNRWYVDGVVSYGLKCGVQDQPGVYTRVPHYAPWIRKHTGSKCGDPAEVWNS